jgi:O-antigen ligase
VGSTPTLRYVPGTYSSPYLLRWRAGPLAAAACITFALMFFVGDLKGNLQTEWAPSASAAIPFDLTAAVFFVGLIVSALSFLGRKGKIQTQVMWMFALFLAFSISILWTQFTPYAVEKITRLFTLSLVAATLPAITLTRLKDIKLFITTIIVAGTAISLAGFMQVLTGSSLNGRISGINADTISLGRNSGIALVGLYTLVSCDRKRRLLLATFCLPLLMVLVASGSRGPALFAMAVIVFVTVRWARMNLPVIGIALALFAIAGFFLAQDPPILPKGSVDRILAFIEQRYDSSAQERVVAGGAALHEIGNVPLGLGIGGFGKIYNFGSVTDHIYPHNIVLEIAVEDGWLVGLFFLLIVLIALVRGYRSANAEPALRTFFAVFIYALCNALVSGDMNDNRIVYALVCIAMLSPGLLARIPPTYAEVPDTLAIRPRFQKVP